MEVQPRTQVFIVRGHVQRANGKPVAAMLVRAYDRDLRSEQFLNETHTDASGAYEISYTAAQFLDRKSTRLNSSHRL